jgi:hypothetical protein
MLSTGFMIASVPFHRLVFRRGMKEDLIRATQRFVGAGLTFLFLTMVGAVLLVFDFLVSRPAAIVVTAALALAYLILWLVIPVHQRTCH